MSGTQGALSLGVAIAVFCAGGVTLIRAVRAGAGPPSRPLACAALLALALLAAPVVWPHYHVLQLPGVALIGDRFIRRRSWPHLVVLGVASIASTWAAPLLLGPYAARFGTTVSYPPLLWALTSLAPAGALAILALCVGELARDSRAGNRQTSPGNGAAGVESQP